MPTFVLSDLHLDVSGDGQLFDDRRQGKALAALCERLAQQPGAELVLLGDTFDLTAMLPPQQGLEKFSRRVEVPIEPPPPMTAVQMCGRLAEDNPVGVQALARLAERIPVFVVPGNHDYLLTPEALQAAGLGRARLQKVIERNLQGRTVVLMHGHEFDKGNAEPGGPGEQMTRCLHHALLPFLRKHGARKHVRMDPERMLAMRPEEAVVTVLQRWLEPHVFRRVFRAFVDLLAENDYLPSALAFLAGLVSADRVRASVQAQDRMWERAGATALDCIRGERPLPHGAPRPDLLVLGHTHVLDWSPEKDDRLYVNLGTWTERASDAFGPFDTTLPLLEMRIENGAAAVLLHDLAGQRELQRYAVTARET